MKERLIGACILVALAVIFIPMFFEGPERGAMVTSQVDLPAAATAVSTYRVSLNSNAPPEPISPRAAAGEAPPARSGRIDRPEANGNTSEEPAESQPSTVTTVPIDLSLDHGAHKEKETAARPADAPPPDPDAALSGWFVQAGSFLHQNYAKRLTARLKDKGFDAFTLRAQSSGKTYYRVRVGPLGARREAEQLAPAIAAAAGGPTQVLSEP